MLAHSTAADRKELDDLSWYIENEIGIIYTMLGNYDQALYFLDQTQQALLADSLDDKSLEKLSRLATNIGIAQSSKGQHIEAISTFRKAYLYATQNDLIRARFSNSNQLSLSYLNLNNIDSSQYYFDISRDLLDKLNTQPRFQAAKALSMIMKPAYLQSAVNTMKHYQHYL